MISLGCENLDVRIAGIKVVSGLQLELATGEFWGLLGPNGIGKTTLLKCLAGLTAPASGRVLLESGDIAELPRKLLARHMGMLQQHTVYVFDSSVMQTALTGRHPHRTERALKICIKPALPCTLWISMDLQIVVSPGCRVAKPGGLHLQHYLSRNRISCCWMNPLTTWT